MSAACAACSGDDGGPIDAGDGDGDIDAAPLVFETQATDMSAQTALFDVSVSEEGADNQTSSAPNGRAVLELRGDAIILHELAGFLSNRMSVSAEALAAHDAARQPQLSELVVAADLDDIYSGVGVVRDSGATQVLIYVRGAASFAPAAGVSIAGGTQTLVRRAAGAYEVGDTVVDDALVIIPNAAGATLSITPSGSCTGATDISLLPGHLASTFLVCQ